jgi:hypothetical protein
MGSIILATFSEAQRHRPRPNIHKEFCRDQIAWGGLIVRQARQERTAIAFIDRIHHSFRTEFPMLVVQVPREGDGQAKTAARVDTEQPNLIISLTNVEPEMLDGARAGKNGRGAEIPNEYPGNRRGLEIILQPVPHDALRYRLEDCPHAARILADHGRMRGPGLRDTPNEKPQGTTMLHEEHLRGLQQWLNIREARAARPRRHTIDVVHRMIIRTQNSLLCPKTRHSIHSRCSSNATPTTAKQTNTSAVIKARIFTASWWCLISLFHHMRHLAKKARLR